MKKQNLIILGDCEDYLPLLPDETFDLIYIDPPFNTGKKQKRTRIRASSKTNGTRKGFGNRLYSTEIIPSPSFDDNFENYLEFLQNKLVAAHRLLTPKGSLFVHLDYREAHYVKVLLDQIFGRQSFINEIIWAYDYGARSKTRWSPKHNTILWYAKNPRNYIFNYDAIDRIPYLAPNLVSKEKAEQGKTPTDVWWMTIVPTNSKEKTGYPTQKPLKLLERIVRVHSHNDSFILDFFAGSGTTGYAAAKYQRHYCLIDKNPSAFEIMQKRLANTQPICFTSKEQLESYLSNNKT